MAKPRLEKVEALFYVLKQVAKGGCIRILIHPLFVLFVPDQMERRRRVFISSWLIGFSFLIALVKGT